MSLKVVSQTVTESNFGRADAFVRELCATSHSQSRGMFDRGCVSINGESCSNPGAPLEVGDEVSVSYDPTQRYREKKTRTWDDRTFTIAYEDEHLIVVDKAAGTLTVPTDRGDPNTLVERVSVYLSHSRTEREACLVHRLDREVSGLLIFGKHAAIAQLLIEQFKLQKPQRIYNAIVAGKLAEQEGTFRAHLATGNNLDRYVTTPFKDSEEAITHYRVLKDLGDTTLVEVKLQTGKRNQIRVQFAHALHPVLGDLRYRPDLSQHQRWIRKRIALHATSLSFVHPVTGEELSLHSPLPAAMSKFIKGSPKVP
ncbi:RluA family pseudouridine synthase [Allorhodopirellula heiligendammensis]|uniref:Ribosomal large subunit pseudouridine synthase D n=1 Tax=Allorhodopirellula heiligendammensis TaxID=2714739 RepID=A0A5C6BGQ6_9BACT|nr:RluA family pseudouridine synthase [Allorhodopirellula heiligendammensis]TWU10671.1 Ribosomal large subunit pseudouridine synthase D [Allorhodopirellula heiligendammensis]